MKRFLVLFALLSFGLFACAEIDQNVIKEDPFKVTVGPYSQQVSQPKPQPVEVIKYKDREVIKEVEIVPKDAIRVRNLTWETSDNRKEITSNSKSGMMFDLGVAYQMGIIDALSGRKFSKEERLQVYPLFGEYQKRSEVSYVNINVAYEGGFQMGLKIKEGVPLTPAPPTPPPTATKK